MENTKKEKKEYTKYLRDHGLKVFEVCGKEFYVLG